MFKLKHRYCEAVSDDVGTENVLGTADNDSNTEPAWPENWRDMYSAGDEKKAERLSRYASPNAAIDAMIAAQNKISSGEYKSTTEFPVNGSDEEKTAWRKDNGIPESADKYDLSLKEGLVVGENDKPVIDDFLQAAHNSNMPPELASGAVQWYFDNQEKQAEAQAEKDAEIAQTTEDSLRAEWGTDYRRNVNSIHSLLDTAPEGVKDNLLSGRLADGTPIASDESTLKFLIDLALQANPVTTLVPGSGANAASAIDDEIKSIKSKFGTKEYLDDEAMQQRYRDLIEAQSKMK